MNDNMKFLVGLAAGAAVGYTLGLLVAPENGQKLRNRILTEADKLAQNLIDQGTDIVKNSPENKSVL